jgi:hypothetical protein
MLYITKYTVMSRRGAGFSWSMGYIQAGTIFDSKNQKNGWVEVSRVHWIPADSCTSQLPPIVEPPNPGNNASIWWAICKSKPYGYKPEGLNYGSFAIGWLMPEEPIGFINKPAGFKLQEHHIAYSHYMNPQNPGAVAWMVDQAGTRKVLQLDGVQYKCPVPCYVEGNPVNVLEWGQLAVRIETVSIYDPLPQTLPNYLCHTWYAYTKGGTFYKVQAAEGGVRYPLFARSNSAWIQRSGIQLERPLLP